MTGASHDYDIEGYFHEAGHACMASYFNALYDVAIESPGKGHTCCLWTEAPRIDALICVAGAAAASWLAKITGRPHAWNLGPSDKDLIGVAHFVGIPREGIIQTEIFSDLLTVAIAFCEEHWGWITAVAMELKEKHYLNEARVRQLGPKGPLGAHIVADAECRRMEAQCRPT